MDNKQKKQYEAVCDYLDQHRDDMIALWRELVSIESGNDDKPGCDAVCARLERELQDIGAETQVLPMETKGNFLKGEWGKAHEQPPILFGGHMDTVFKKGTLQQNPFRIEDGKAYGPGVLDMKAGLVIAVFALKALAYAGYEKSPIRIAFAGDEENGHRSSNAKDVILSAAKGCRAALNFETGYPNDGLVVGRKGSCRVVMEVTGVASHAGNAPELGRNAIQEMAHKVIAVQKLNDLENGTSVNVGLIQGGTVVNAVPDFCRIDIDIRFTKRERLMKLLDEIKAVSETVYIEGTKTKLTILSESLVMETSAPIMELFDHVKQIAEETGYGQVSPIKVGGWSDACLMASVGVPVICGMGVKGEFNHSPKEYAIVESLFSRAKLAAAAVITL